MRLRIPITVRIKMAHKPADPAPSQSRAIKVKDTPGYMLKRYPERAMRVAVDDAIKVVVLSDVGEFIETIWLRVSAVTNTNIHGKVFKDVFWPYAHGIKPGDMITIARNDVATHLRGVKWIDGNFYERTPRKAKQND